MSYYEDYIAPGILCEGCGVFMGGECGHPRRCDRCKHGEHKDAYEEAIIKTLKDKGYTYSDDLSIFRNITNAANSMSRKNLTHCQALERISKDCGFRTYASLKAALGN